MRRHQHRHVPRLRRLARVLAGDTASADALVSAVLAGPGRDCAVFERLASLVVAANRLRPEPQRRQPPAHTQDVARAVAGLPLAAREVLGLVVVEGLDYQATAAVLALGPEQVVRALADARVALARALDGERAVPLRLVK